MSTASLAPDDPVCDLPKADRIRVAYIMSRFPKISETFIFREINAVKARGVEVEIFPLLREPSPVLHTEVVPLVAAARFSPMLSVKIMSDNFVELLRSPIRYLSAFFESLRASFGSRRFFLGAIAYFPKAIYFSAEMRRLGVHHIHAHFASFPAAVALVVHRVSGIPFSFTAHGSDLHRDQTMLREKVHASSFAVTVSDYNRDIILRECGLEVGFKVPVIRCGVDASFFQPRHCKSAFEKGKGPLKIVCTGTLHEVKGRFI